MSRKKKTFKFALIDHMEGQLNWSDRLINSLTKKCLERDKTIKLHFFKLNPNNSFEECNEIIQKVDYAIFRLVNKDKNTKPAFEKFIPNITFGDKQVIFISSYATYFYFLNKLMPNNIDYRILNNNPEFINYMLEECLLK